jgi:uncharacterized membrane protein YhaH (DUF805 family)
MFNFVGVINRGTFLRASGLRLALFIASVVGFPFLLMAIVAASNCKGAGGACGALGLVVGTAFKPLAFILFVVSFCGISVRRARDAGMWGPVGLFIPLLFASNYAFLIYAGAPWSVGFSAGVLHLTFPWASVLALYCILILCVLPSRPREDANPFGTAGWIAFGLGLLIAANAVLQYAMTNPGIHLWSLPFGWMLGYVTRIATYAMAAFATALAWIAFQYRAPSVEAVLPPVPSRDAPAPVAPPVGRLLALALIPTLIACAIGFGKEVAGLLPFALIVNMGSIVLPTLAMYFFLLLGVWFVWVRRTPYSLAILLLALTPFLHWAYAHWTSFNEHQREAAEVAAVQTKPAPRLPATMVFESPHTEGLQGAWTVPSIDRVIVKGPYGSKLMQFERARLGGSRKQPAETASLPDEYLLLKVGRSSGFAKNRQTYWANGGPFELRYVAPSRDDLVAVSYRAFNPGPSILPVLTSSGWFRGSNGVLAGEIDKTVGAFLTTSLRTSS